MEVPQELDTGPSPCTAPRIPCLSSGSHEAPWDLPKRQPHPCGPLPVWPSRSGCRTITETPQYPVLGEIRGHSAIPPQPETPASVRPAAKSPRGRLLIRWESTVSRQKVQELGPLRREPECLTERGISRQTETKISSLSTPHRSNFWGEWDGRGTQGHPVSTDNPWGRAFNTSRSYGNLPMILLIMAGTSSLGSLYLPAPHRENFSLEQTLLNSHTRSSVLTQHSWQ